LSEGQNRSLIYISCLDGHSNVDLFPFFKAFTAFACFSGEKRVASGAHKGIKIAQAISEHFLKGYAPPITTSSVVGNDGSSY